MNFTFTYLFFSVYVGMCRILRSLCECLPFDVSREAMRAGSNPYESRVPPQREADDPDSIIKKKKIKKRQSLPPPLPSLRKALYLLLRQIRFDRQEIADVVEDDLHQPLLSLLLVFHNTALCALRLNRLLLLVPPHHLRQVLPPVLGRHGGRSSAVPPSAST